jgi:peptidoglycan/LPS O-acetylase OafA/YrhL
VGVTPEHVHSGRIAYFDGWRGLSILLVLVGHFLGETRLGLSSLGVELFFVLSGRLMADILFAERYPLPDFFKRRISRVYPGLLVFVLVTWVATAMTHAGLAFKAQAVAAALTFTLNYAIVLHHGVQAIENLWSLCIEEHAYLFLGVVALLSRRWRFDPLWLVAGAALASMLDALVSSLLLRQPGLSVYWRTDAHVCSILWAVAAFLVLRDLKAWGAASPLLLAGAVAAAAGSEALKFAVVPILAGVSITALGEAPRILRAALSFRPLTQLGVWSYSVYLWQQPFSRMARDGDLPAWAALAAGLACGVASFYLVEQPARRFLNAAWRARPARDRSGFPLTPTLRPEPEGLAAAPAPDKPFALGEPG